MALGSGNSSGIGPADGGFRPTSGDYIQRQLDANKSRTLMDSALMNSPQMRSYIQNYVSKMAGSTAGAYASLQNSPEGYLQMVAGQALISRGFMGNGDPRSHMYGLQQMIGAGNRIVDARGADSIMQRFGGRGDVTNMLAKQMYSRQQEVFYGKNGQYNNVSGLNMTELGVLQSQMAAQGFRPSGPLGTLKDMDLSERLRNASDTQEDPGLKKLMRQIGKEKDPEAQKRRLDSAIKNAAADKNTAAEKALIQVRDSKMGMVLNDMPQKEIESATRAAAEMVRGLSDATGNTNVAELVSLARRSTGISMKGAKSVARAKESLDRSMAYAKSASMDVNAFLETIDTMGQTTGASIEYAMGQRLGIAVTPGVATNIGRRYQASQMGTTAASMKENEAVAEGALGRRVSEEEIHREVNTAYTDRLVNDPELLLMSEFMGMNQNFNNPKLKAEADSLMAQYSSAKTPEERQNAKAAMNRFFTAQGVNVDAKYAAHNRESLLRSFEQSQYSDSVNAAVSTETSNRGATFAVNMAKRENINTSKLLNRDDSLSKTLKEMPTAVGVDAWSEYLDAVNEKDPEAKRKSIEGWVAKHGKYFENVSSEQLTKGMTDMSEKDIYDTTEFMANVRGRKEFAAVKSRETRAAEELAITQQRQKSGTDAKAGIGKKTLVELLAEGFFSDASGAVSQDKVVQSLARDGKGVTLGNQTNGLMDITEEKFSEMTGKMGKNYTDGLLKATGMGSAKELQDALRDPNNTKTHAAVQAYMRANGAVSATEDDTTITTRDAVDAFVKDNGLANQSKAGFLQAADLSTTVKDATGKEVRKKYSEMTAEEKVQAQSKSFKDQLGGNEAALDALATTDEGRAKFRAGISGMDEKSKSDLMGSLNSAKERADANVRKNSNAKSDEDKEALKSAIATSKNIQKLIDEMTGKAQESTFVNATFINAKLEP